MSDSSRAGTARAVTHRLRRGASFVRHRTPLRRLTRPTVSVILPIYNVEKYLEECLDSLAEQTYGNYEVVVVDDGSPDGSRAIAERYARQDHRITVVSRPNGGLGAARNTGVRHARGTYLAFVDSDDTLPPYALGLLVDKAEASQADITVGAMRRFDSERTWLPGWTARVHLEERVLHRIEEFPPLLRNLYTCNKLFRRDFWTEQGLWFREGVAYEDQPLVTQLYAKASTIAVVREPVYNYRARDDKSSISQQTASLKDLRDRVAAWHATRDALVGTVSDQVYLGWLQTLFDAHFHWYLASPGTADDTYWDELHAAVVDFTEDAPQALWDAALPDRRVLLELARQDRRADAQEFVRQDGRRLDLWEPVPREDGVLLEMPFHDDPRLDERLFVMRPEQLRLGQSVEHLRWLPDDTASPGTCEISGWAYIRKVDPTRYDTEVSFVLRNARSGEEHEFGSIDRPRAAFPPPGDDPWCDYSPGTFRAQVPVGDVLATGAPGDTWSLLVRVVAAGFTVTEPVTQLVRSGSAGLVPAFRLKDGSRLVLNWRIHEPVRLELQPARLRAVDLRLEGRTLTGTLTGPAAGEVTRLEAATPRVVQRARLGRGQAERSFTLELPPAPGLGDRSPVQWGVTAYAGSPDGAGVGVDLERDLEVRSRHGVLAAQASRNETLSVGEWTVRADADHVEVSDQGVLTVRGSLVGRGIRAVALRARSKKSRTLGEPVPVEGERFEATLPLTHDLYRFGARPLPTGEHDVSLVVTTEDGSQREVALRMSALVNDSLPVVVDTEHHEGRLVRGPGGSPRVSLVRPLRDARGRYHQRLLRHERPRGTATHRGLLLRSYFGEHATDNGISIQRELRRRGSDLPVYWAVQDHSVPVPEGGIPVIVNSREWFDLLGSVTYYVDNMYQPEYHLKPEGQVLVETFHGYPFKTMGHQHWDNLQVSQARIDSYDARAADWDYLVSPAVYATPLLTDAFRYRGEVLEIGYPRNDVLLSDEADEIRAQTRSSLGVHDDQVAVLYAPTFRDYMATGDSRAVMADFLDFRAASKALGKDYVILVRGHAFNARSRLRVGDLDGVVDVTDYPEVSDLYLAADAGIVDYSSLRFDFGVTGKPMIFNVPDLQRYKDSRGWLFDFEPTAPGPFVASTEEIVEQLRDLDGVRARHAADYEAFRSGYLSLEDGNAGRRFVDAVLAPRGDA